MISVETEEVPHLSPNERVEVEDLPAGFRRTVLQFGFMDEPDVPRTLRKPNWGAMSIWTK